MIYAGLFIVGSLVALNAHATRRVLGSRASEHAEKRRQLFLVWLVPLFGALLVLHALKELHRARGFGGPAHSLVNPDAAWYVPGPAPDAPCTPGDGGCE